MKDHYTVTTSQVNPASGEYVLTSYATEDTLAEAEARIERAIAFYRERGYAVAYRVTHQHAEVLSGAWGLDGDDWAEPPTVRNEVI